MTEAIDVLWKKARAIKATPEHREEQRRSFAYGNTHLENKDITREMIAEEADKLDRERAKGKDPSEGGGR